MSAINAAWIFIQNVLSGSTDPALTHIWLIGICIFGSLAVAFGIILESWPPHSAKAVIAMVLVLGGVVLEGAFTVVLFVYDEALSSTLERKLAARTQELLAVRKLTADRSLSPDEQKSLTAALAVFPGQHAKIVVFPVTFESTWLARQIVGAMLNAKWNVAPPEQLTAPNDFMVQGSFIDASDDEASRKAAKALFEALKSTGVPSSSALLGPLVGQRLQPLQFDPSQPLVWMLIGDKPVPILDWIK